MPNAPDPRTGDRASKYVIDQIDGATRDLNTRLETARGNAFNDISANAFIGSLGTGFSIGLIATSEFGPGAILGGIAGAIIALGTTGVMSANSFANLRNTICGEVAQHHRTVTYAFDECSK